ncbi:DUF418 domain-containing protein [bacterium]|nr:DUF418 domain-containing protein [bacterium]
MTDGNPPTLTASGHERIQTIDVLRGLALFGIIVVNAWFFGFPMMKATGQLDMDTNGADTAARFVVTAFFQFKFISIFSILFGFGIAMQHSRLIERTGSAAGFLARRMIILAMFGLVHAIGIWYGDILFQYAIVGMMMILLIQIPSGIRLTLGIVCMAVSMLAIFGFGMLSMIETPVVADPDLSLRGFEAMRAGGFDPASANWTAAEIAAFREGPFIDVFLFRTTTWVFATLLFPLTYGWHVLGLVLIGSWFHDVRLFSPERRRLLGRLAIWGVAIGLPMEVLLTTARLFGDLEIWQRSMIDGIHDVTSAVLALGIIGVVGRACAAHRMPLSHSLASVGRMSLSAYILESILFTGLVSFWGLGLFNQLGHATLFGASIAIYGLVATACILWLRHFRIGPLEWIWRWGAYLGRP